MQKKGKYRAKGSARSLRREDMIPAVLYREGKAQSIKLARKELCQAYKHYFRGTGHC